MNFILLIGSILGFSSVVMGAYSRHALKAKLTEEQFHTLSTALHYHQMYALLITAMGLCLLVPLSVQVKKYLKCTAWVFILGVILFSFSIYLALFTGVTLFTMAAPVGGVTLMLAWVLLACVAVGASRTTS